MMGHNGPSEMGTILGRLKYRTAEEARGAARDLGISGVHSHMIDGERVFMPGSDHEKLNKALRKQGRPPTKMPGKQDSGAMMNGMMTGMMSDGDETDVVDPEPMMDGDGEVEVDMPEMMGDSAMFGDEDDDGNMELY